MSMRTLAAIPVVLAMAFSLAACTGDPPAEPTEQPTEAATPTPTPTQTSQARVFSMPQDCFGMLPQARQDTFASQGLILLGGPGGQYEQYYADPTPEEQAGGISCIWGDENVPESTVTISVAPLSDGTRAGVVDTLIAQGLNEAVLDDGISYAQLGDETSAPAILNIVRDDSWVSVIEALGGEAFFDEAVELANEIAEQVYAP